MKLMRHSEFLKHCRKITDDIKKYIDTNKIKIDYIIPILRSGAVPAVYISNELNIVKMLPLQIKKVEQNNKAETIVLLNFVKDLEIKKDATVLVVDASCSSGESAELAINEIKKYKPGLKIMFACLFVRNKNSLPKNSLKNFYAFFKGRRKQFAYPWEECQLSGERPDVEPKNIF